MQRRSAAEIAERRAAIVAAVREVAPLELVNGGGTGSLATTAAEDAVTEVTAGSGFYAPTLFDRYSTLHACARRRCSRCRSCGAPAPAWPPLLGGGYHASGAAGRDRLPEPYLPHGLRLDAREGAGEVQTPVHRRRRPRAARSATASTCATPRRASCASASTPCCWSSGGEVVDEVPTYRGEGKTFL